MVDVCVSLCTAGRWTSLSGHQSLRSDLREEKDGRSKETWVQKCNGTRAAMASSWRGGLRLRCAMVRLRAYVDSCMVPSFRLAGPELLLHLSPNLGNLGTSRCLVMARCHGIPTVRLVASLCSVVGRMAGSERGLRATTRLVPRVVRAAVCPCSVGSKLKLWRSRCPAISPWLVCRGYPPGGLRLALRGKSMSPTLAWVCSGLRLALRGKSMSPVQAFSGHRGHRLAPWGKYRSPLLCGAVPFWWYPTECSTCRMGLILWLCQCWTGISVGAGMQWCSPANEGGGMASTCQLNSSAHCGCCEVAEWQHAPCAGGGRRWVATLFICYVTNCYDDDGPDTWCGRARVTYDRRGQGLPCRSRQFFTRTFWRHGLPCRSRQFFTRAFWRHGLPCRSRQFFTRAFCDRQRW